MSSTFEHDQVGRVPAGVTLRPTGDLDFVTSPAEFARVIGAEPQIGDTVVIDLAGVTFIDSSGVMMLLKAKAYLDGMACRLVLANVPAPVARLFAILALNDVFGLDPHTPDT